MPRTKEDAATLLQDLRLRLGRLVEVALREGRDAALEEVRSLMSGGAPTKVRRGPGRPKGKKNGFSLFGMGSSWRRVCRVA
ncbi:MAG: hypothetical protein HMLKMBBP_01686 [Planctomycetes bacterium]|nr:hypothetical protein [Planctomycetota bacterium]